MRQRTRASLGTAPALFCGMTMVGLVADIHANAPALEAVLTECAHRGVATIWCAGDVVGYNAFVSETLTLARNAGILAVLGNHDLMATGQLSSERSGPRARRAAAWARTHLSDDERAWLAELPLTRHVADDVLCVHSTIGDTEARLDSDDDYRRQAVTMRALDPMLRLCINGHTHRAGAVRVAADGRVERHREARATLDRDSFWFVNPGSVGEPRDGETHARFALLDLDARDVRFHRVRYDRSLVVRTNATRFPPLEGYAPESGAGAGAWLRRMMGRLAHGTA